VSRFGENVTRFY